MDFVFGIIGFIGFEALRIYKRIWAGLPIIPENNKILYIVTIFFISIFSGSVSLGLAENNIIRALFLGFSVPTSMKAIFEKSNNTDSIDDIEIQMKNIKFTISNWFNIYFRFK